MPPHEAIYTWRRFDEGSHVMMAWRATQAIAALSSAKAGMIAFVRAGSEGLVVIGLLLDMGQQSTIQV